MPFCSQLLYLIQQNVGNKPITQICLLIIWGMEISANISLVLIICFLLDALYQWILPILSIGWNGENRDLEWINRCFQGHTSGKQWSRNSWINVTLFSTLSLKHYVTSQLLLNFKNPRRWRLTLFIKLKSSKMYIKSFRKNDGMAYLGSSVRKICS